MSVKTTFMYLFVGLNIFSMNLKASESSAFANLDVEAKKHHHHHSCSSSSHHHHRHCFKFKDIAEIVLLSEFRHSASRFILTSSQRTFDVWGHRHLVALAEDVQEITFADNESFDVNQVPSKAELERMVALNSATASERVLAGFTLVHAFAAAASSNAGLRCHEFFDFEFSWLLFAVVDILQTRDPNLSRSIALIRTAANVGAQYDECLHLNDNNVMLQMQARVAAVASKLGAGLEENPELREKFKSFAEARLDVDFPVFEVLFGIIGATRATANGLAKQASTTSPIISAEIIYGLSQLFVEASADLMDIATFGISVIGLIENNHHHSD